MRRIALLSMGLGILALGATICSTLAEAAPPAEPVESILCRAFSAEGFSYAWGGECWQATGCSPDTSGGVGVCDGCNDGDGCNTCGTSSGCCVNGASCQHSGTWGADCSGFVSKAWQVPDPHPVDACGVARFTASAFTQDHAYWDNLSVANLQPGDAAATSHHVILVVGPKDAYGDYDVMEAQGCTPGIVRHNRSISTSFTGAHRINLTQCVCQAGDAETQACGDCGEQERHCVNDCLWSGWSPCEGTDPSGPDAACTGEGQGVCAQGRRRCVAGWLTCEQNRPSADVCDGLDNDCDGQVDNGTPEILGEGLPCVNACGEGTSRCVEGQVTCVSQGAGFPDEVCDGLDNDCDGRVDEDTPSIMGAAAPPIAASVESIKTPSQILVGVPAEVQISVRNRGRVDWAPGQVRLVVPANGGPSLRPETGWESDRVVLRNTHLVPSGEAATFAFPVLVATDPGGPLDATLVLETDAGPIPCPAPTVALTLRVGGKAHSGCACSAGGSPPTPLVFFGGLLIALILRRRRRRPPRVAE